MKILDLFITPGMISYYVFWSTKQDKLIQYIATTFSCLDCIEIHRLEYIPLNQHIKLKMHIWRAHDYF